MVSIEQRLLIPGVFKFLKILTGSYLPCKKRKYYFSIVAIVKNEGEYLKEWFNYYLSLGVDHFFIYDNGSSDKTQNVIREYKNCITYKKYDGYAKQMDAYNDALNNFGKLTKYMGFLDIDEFIVVKNGKGLKEIFDKFFSLPHVGGIVINWQIFGSSHYKKKPQGLVTNNFVYRARKDFYTNRHIKSIVDPRKTIGFINEPHSVCFLPGFWAINEKKNRVDGPLANEVCTEIIQLNHYFTKSKEEFIKKRQRGQATVEKPRTLMDFTFHDKNDLFDDTLRSYNKLHNLK